ncbi:MAG TPA: DUF962 domain-containing protein [bacterium]|nr:DUF962 domain-containing protein [bacterium]
MAAERAYKTFQEFWPFYLGEHSKPITRAFHFVGTSIALFDILGAVVLRDPRYLLAAPVSAYGMAWISHFFLEKNRPATFTYPLWSLMGDFKMLGFMATGKIGAELDRLKIVPKDSAGSVAPRA